MNDSYDIAILGAGAAGLACAIFAGEAAAQRMPFPRIVLLDGAPTPGAKILVSGGGRCNVTHDEMTVEDFHGSRNIIRNVLAAFDEKATVGWMLALGVELKREGTGKLFPTSDSARTVLNALQSRVGALRIEQRNSCRITAVSHGTDGDGFELTHANDTLRARRLIMATGGRSLPRTGSDGAGYELVKSLGHTVTPTFAALAPLVLAPDFFHSSLSGLAQDVELTCRVNDKVVDRRAGSMLWTHFGISGPVVMDISRFWIGAKSGQLPASLHCNFFPGQDFERVDRQFIETASASSRTTVLKTLAGLLPERLARTLLQFAGISADILLPQLPRESRRRLVHLLTGLELPVQHDRGWNYAEVTAGGVPLREIDYRTMASRVRPGLFLAGEILDCDGRIGGFNFQWAWATGYVAGRAAVQSLSVP